MILLSRLLLTLALAACHKKNNQSAEPPTAPESSEQIGKIIGPEGKDFSYYKDIKALVDLKCASCHSAGGLAGLELNSFEQVKAKKASIRSAVIERRMPPWLAEEGHQNYRDNLSLSAAEIAKLVQWIDLGAKPGNPMDYVMTTKPDGFQPDLNLPIFRTNETFLPEQTVSDEYRCFVIPFDAMLTDNKFVTGFTAQAGNKKITHHLVAYLASADIVSVLQELDDQEAGKGYRCFGGATPDRLGDEAVQSTLEAKYPGILKKLSNETYWLAHWAPGMDGGYTFPAGTGIKIPVGGAFVIQVHYYTEDAKGEPDQGTNFGLKLAKNVEKPAFYFPLTNQSWLQSKRNGSMVIPAHESAIFSVERNLADIVGYGRGVLDLQSAAVKNLEIHSANLHMHAIGASGTINLNRVDQSQSETLLNVKEWDLHWQRDFQFVKPKIISASEWSQWVNKVTCNYVNDKSAEVFGGFGSMDEMCFNFGYFAFDLSPNR